MAALNRRSRLLLALPLLLVPSLLLVGHPRPGPADPVWRLPAASSAQSVQVTAQLLEDPRPDRSGGRCRALAQLVGGRSELQFSPCPRLQQGWRVQLSGSLRRLPAAPHPLLAGSAQRLQRLGVWTQLRVEQWRLLQRPATPVADLRRRMGEALRRAGGEQAGSVLAALVLGSAASPVPAAVNDAFRAAGLSHALAASGFHLTVLLGAVMLPGRRLSGPWRWGLASSAMGLFLLLAGPQPSVVRAVLMGAVAFALQESGRCSRPMAVLGVCVVVMLLCRPSWLLDVGFQLSVAATAGLLVSAHPLEQLLRQWMPSWAATALAVPVAASLWTLPLQLLHFGVLPIYAVPANLLVGPLLTPLTLGAMAMALAAVLAPPLLTPLGWLLVPLTRLFVWLVQQLAALPMAQWPLGRMSPLLALLLALALLPWLWPAARPWRRWALLLLVLVAMLQAQQLRGDQLLLVEEGSRQWLLARHGGRGALVSRAADGLSCSRAAQLAQGLGIGRYDWVLLLDPVPAEQPSCWTDLTPTLLGPHEGGQALQPGQRLFSPGLSVQALASDSQALVLEVGRLRWGLLPDRQAWWSWRDQAVTRMARVDGLWLGFRPRASERRQLPPLPSQRLWWPAAGSASGWRQA